MTVKQLKESLLKQLKSKGADTEHFTNLIEDYCFFWTQERKMQADVRKKGLTYPAISAVGKEYEKENPSVKAAMLYSRHQLTILRELGLTTETAPQDDARNEDDASGL